MGYKIGTLGGKNGLSGFYTSRFTCINLQISITSGNTVVLQESQS